MRDGVYQVTYGTLCAGFVVRQGQAIRCAPILQRRIDYWKKIAHRIPRLSESSNVARRRNGMSLKDKWKKGKKKAGDEALVPVPVAKYAMQLVEADTLDAKGERNVLAKWVVLQEMEGDEEHRGKLCKEFYNIEDEDRIIWIQRAMKTLGIDLDEEEVEDEDDLLALWHQMIEEQVVALVAVTEDGPYTNMRIKQRLDSDDYETVDAEEAAKGELSSDDDDDEDEDETEWEKGDEVTFEDKKGNEHTGKITKINEEDETANVKVGNKTHKDIPLDELEAPGGEDEEDEEDEDDGYTPEEGDEVTFELDDEEVEGVVKSVNEKKETAKVKVGKKTHTVDWSDLSEKSDDDDEESEDDDDSESFEEGDSVTFKKGKKEHEGEIVEVDEDEETAVIKVGKKKHKDIPFSDITKADSDDDDDDDSEDEPHEFAVDDIIMHDGKKHKITKVDKKKEKVKAKPVKGKGKEVTIDFDDVDYATD